MDRKITEDVHGFGYKLSAIEAAALIVGRATSLKALEASWISYGHWCRVVLGPNSPIGETKWTGEPNSTVPPEPSPTESEKSGESRERNPSALSESTWSPWSEPLMVLMDTSGSTIIASCSDISVETATLHVADAFSPHPHTGERFRQLGRMIGRVGLFIVLSLTLIPIFFFLLLVGAPVPEYAVLQLLSYVGFSKTT